MEANQNKPEPEIIMPTPEETKALAVPCQLHWKTVAYTIAAFSLKVGNPLGGEHFRVDHIFGRCLGERSDGRTFFATTILPWIWDEGYEWKMIARARLDSFLFPECACDAREEETKVCQHHLELMQEWEYADRRNMRTEEAKTGPKAEEGAGVFATSKPMNLDYPWARITSDGRQMCTICGYGRGEYGAIGNPTYRNIFIRDHSHCGFGNPEQYAPKPFGKITMLPKEVFAHLKAIQGEVERISGAGNLIQEFKDAQTEKVKTANPSFHRAEHVCLNCKRGVYMGEDGVLYHLDLMRDCHWDGRTQAAA